MELSTGLRDDIKMMYADILSAYIFVELIRAIHAI